MTLTDGDQSFSEDISVPRMKWFETPSFVQNGAGNYPSARSRRVATLSMNGENRAEKRNLTITLNPHNKK